MVLSASDIVDTPIGYRPKGWGEGLSEGKKADVKEKQNREAHGAGSHEQRGKELLSRRLREQKGEKQKARSRRKDRKEK